MQAEVWAHSGLPKYLLHQLIRQGKITLAGHKRNKIYGRLDCLSGKRMLREKRLFFGDVEQAESLGYRPCGHCFHREYQRYKRCSLAIDSLDGMR